MNPLHLYIMIYVILFFQNNFISASVDLSFSKKEVVELEDLCLRRPYHKTAEPWYFVPMFRAKLKEVGDKYSFPSRCFKKNIVSFKEMSQDKITLTLESLNKTDTWCSELFIFHTSNHNYFQYVAFQGSHEIILRRITQDDKDEIKMNGVKLYGFCAGLFNTIKSLLKTLKAFLGGLGSDPNAKNPLFRPSVPREMERANLRILELFNHYILERRNDTIVKFDKSIVKSGDFLVISRMDGLDPLIMVGSGGHSGHNAVCTWIDGELYVLESQDGWYWPRTGVQKNKWEQWIEWAHNADYNVALLPLKEEYRKKFDVDKANEWFLNEAEGLPYGYHNFILTWIDTPYNNFPFFATSEITEFLFSVVSYVYPKASDLIITEALNIRAGTNGLTLQQVIAEIARQGKSVEEILAEPEMEGVQYHDGSNYVCSCLVVSFWKHGGLFGDLEFSPNEFGPKDIYILDIFDKNFEKPQECIDDNPDLPYCQVMGRFVFTLDDYSTMKPYAHMNEKCSSEGPDFIREEGC